MSEKREPRTWFVLIPEGDDVQFARSPFLDGKLIIGDSKSLKATMDNAAEKAFFGVPVFKAEFGPIKLLDHIPIKPFDLRNITTT